jgi:hypothetical protein
MQGALRRPPTPLRSSRWWRLGTKLRPFPGNDGEAFKQRMGCIRELSAKNEAGQDLRGLRQVPRRPEPWFRFTEATFDRFMQAQKL